MKQPEPEVQKIDATFRIDEDIYADLMLMTTDEEYMGAAGLLSIDGAVQSYLIAVITGYDCWKAKRKYSDRHCGHVQE